MAIVTEAQYICDICGKKKPVSQMAGKCVVCGQYVCSSCANLVKDKIYCEAHVPEEENGGCFIATAAYGTPMARELGILRSFRDKKLKTNAVGVQIVRLYYKISPPIAVRIANSEGLRILIRCCLNPIIQKLRRT